MAGGFDLLVLLGSLRIAWGAYLAWVGSFSLEGRLLWAATIVACGATALGSVDLSGILSFPLSDVGQLVGMNSTAWALVAMTRECCLDITRRWTTFARVLGLLSFAATAVALLAWNVGSPIEQGVGGAFVSVGEVRFSMPGWSWPIVTTCMLGLVATAVWGVVLGFLTYRQAKGALRV